VNSAPESVSEFGLNHQRMDETAILKTRPRVATLKLFTAVNSFIMHFKDFYRFTLLYSHSPEKFRAVKVYIFMAFTTVKRIFTGLHLLLLIFANLTNF
jgi:hypothetical protein